MFSLSIQTYASLEMLTNSLLALLVAEVGLVELRLQCGGSADLLVCVCLVECAGTGALGVHLVGNSVFGVTCVRCVSFLRPRSIDQYTRVYKTYL